MDIPKFIPQSNSISWWFSIRKYYLNTPGIELDTCNQNLYPKEMNIIQYKNGISEYPIYRKPGVKL